MPRIKVSKEETYKNELLKKYLNKSISKDERHRLEKLALDDSFLFEAMEGYSEVSADHREVVERINSKLTQAEKSSHRKFPFAIAASLILLCGISFLFWQNGAENIENLAVASKEEKKMEAPVVEDVAIISEVDKDLKLSEEIEKEAEPKLVETTVTKPQEDLAATADVIKAKDNNFDGLNQNQVQRVPSRSEIDQGLAEESATDWVKESKEAPKVMPSKAAPVPEMAEGVLGVQSEVNELDDNILADEVEMKEKIEAPVDAFDADAVVVEERKSEEAMDQDITSSAEPMGKSTEFGNSSQRSKSKKSIPSSFRDEFEKYLYEKMGSYLNEEDIKKLSKGVALQFRYDGQNISNFKVSPSQDPKVNALLLELVKGGADYLNEYNGLQEYILN